jgi:hypothetical protein
MLPVRVPCDRSRACISGRAAGRGCRRQDLPSRRSRTPFGYIGIPHPGLGALALSRRAGSPHVRCLVVSHPTTAATAFTTSSTIPIPLALST